MTDKAIEQLSKEWETNPRWKGVVRDYSAADVVRLRGSVHVEHSLARLGAEKLWRYLHEVWGRLQSLERLFSLGQPLGKARFTLL